MPLERPSGDRAAAVGSSLLAWPAPVNPGAGAGTAPPTITPLWCTSELMNAGVRAMDDRRADPRRLLIGNTLPGVDVAAAAAARLPTAAPALAVPSVIDDDGDSDG